MTRVLAVVNQKGGVGKTTTTINLAASLAAMKRRVLVVDIDPQGNATTGAGIDKRACKRTTYHVLLGETDMAGARVHSQAGGFDIVPSNRELAGAEIELVEMPGREMRLKAALAEAGAGDDGRYDFIFSDGGQLNPRLEIEGLLRTMYDARNTLAVNVAAELERHFGDRLYRTVVPRNVRLAEAPSHGVPAMALEAKSKGALAYYALAGEVIRREEARERALTPNVTTTRAPDAPVAAEE